MKPRRSYDTSSSMDMPSMANGNGDAGSLPAPGADTTPSTTVHSSNETFAYESLGPGSCFCGEVAVRIGPDKGKPPSVVAKPLPPAPPSSFEPSSPDAPIGTWSSRTARVVLVPSSFSSIHSSNTLWPSTRALSRSSSSRAIRSWPELAPVDPSIARGPPVGSASDGTAASPLNALSSRWRRWLFRCLARSCITARSLALYETPT
mmetsp:Transcript_4674/g.19225  ORF Transcript_4674/g.19225 Transcript_4674/m.19225 type:complete len:205 (+) Transcript_4674:1947-2561(+)